MGVGVAVATDEDEFKLDLLGVWAQPSVCVVVPLADEPQSPDSRSSGYTGDVFYDELGVRLDAAGVVTAVRPRSRANQARRRRRRPSASARVAGGGAGSDTRRSEGEIEMAPRASRASDKSFASAAAGDTDPERAEALADTDPELAEALASVTGEKRNEMMRYGSIVEKGLRLSKVVQGEDATTASTRADAVRLFADLIVTRPGGIALLPPSPPPTTDTAARVDEWHAKRKPPRNPKLMESFSRSLSSEADVGTPSLRPTDQSETTEEEDEQLGELIRPPHDGAGAPPAAEAMACGGVGDGDERLLSLLGEDATDFKTGGDGDNETTAENVAGRLQGFGLHRRLSNVGHVGAPLSAEAVTVGFGSFDAERDVDYGDDDGEAALRHGEGPVTRIISWMSGLNRTARRTRESRRADRVYDEDGGGGAPPTADDGIDGGGGSGDGDGDGGATVTLEGNESLREPELEPAEWLGTLEPLNFSETKVLLSKAGVEVTAYKLAPPHPPGWVLDRSVLDDGRPNKPGSAAAAPWLCTRLKPSREHALAVIFAAPLRAADAARRDGNGSPVQSNGARELPRSGEPWWRGTADSERTRDDDASWRELERDRARTVVDPLRVETHFRYIARRCSCTFRLGRFASLSSSSSSERSGGGARPTSLRLAPPEPGGWALDAMDVLQVEIVHVFIFEGIVARSYMNNHALSAH